MDASGTDPLATLEAEVPVGQVVWGRLFLVTFFSC